MHKMSSGSPAPAFEPLEGRLLLTAVDPFFATPLASVYSVAAAGKALAIGIDGGDPNGDPLKITAASDDPNLQAIVLGDQRFARLHFVAADGSDIGDVLVELFDSRAATAAARFSTLATTGYDANGQPDPLAQPFYSNVLVHRVIPDFMIQSGDAYNGDGTGGSPLGKFNNAFDANLSFSGPGVLALANSGANTNDCQFFITDQPTHWLDGNYFIFGQVVSGMDIVHTLINLPRGTNDRPDNPPILQSVDIINSNQDGVVLLIPQAGFDGSAQVTISLNDKPDGTGNSASTTFTVNSDAAYTADPTTPIPKVTPPQQEYFIAPGGSTSFTPTITGPAGATLDVAVTSDVPGVTAAIDPVTHQVDVTVPVDFHRAARIRVTAWVDGYDNVGNWPISEGVVYVSTLGDRPTIDPLDPFYVTPGETFDFTAAIHDDTPATLNANIYSSAPGGVLNYDVSGDGTVTAPADYTGVYYVTLSAVEQTGEPGYVLTPGTQTFKVFTQNATDPPMQTLVPNPFSGSDYSAVRDGDVLYVAGGSGGLQILDVADPLNPFMLGFYDTPGQVRDVQIVHRTISGAPHTIALLCDTGGGIVSLDVTNPGAIPLPLQTVAVNTGIGEYAVAMAVVGNRAYVAEYAGGLVVYDITDPANITKAGAITTLSPTFKLAEAVSVEIKGNYAFVVDANGGSQDGNQWTGVVVIDVTNPAAMRAVNSLSTLVPLKKWGAPWGQDLVGNRLYVADQLIGLLVYDVTKPAAPKLVGVYNDASNPWYVTVVNQMALLGTGAGVKFVNIGDLTRMSASYTYSAPTWAGQPVVTGSSLALPLADLGLVLMDGAPLINQLTTYSSMTFTSTGGVPVTVKITGGGKVVVDTSGIGFGDILGISVVNPTARTIVTVSTPAGTTVAAGGIAVRGSIAAFSAPSINLAGEFVADGSVASLTLNNVNGHDITLHNNPTVVTSPLTRATISLNDVADCQLNANDESIKSLTVRRWLDPTGPADTITAPTLGTLSITGSKAGLLGDFQADLVLTSASGGVNLGSVSIAHDLSDSAWTLVGQVGTITVGGTVSGWDFDAANTVTYVKSMSLGNVSGAASSVAVNGTITTLTAGQWIGGTIGAASIGTLTSGNKFLAGDFSAGVTLTGSAGKVTIGRDLSGGWSAVSVGTLTVKRNMTNAQLTLTRAADPLRRLWALGTLTVTGAMDHSWIRSSGNINSATMTRLLDSAVYAGVAAVHDDLPAGSPAGDGVFDLFDPAVDTFDQAAYIKTLTVKGTKDGSVALRNSNIAAKTLGTIKLVNAQFNNGTTPFGLAADNLVKFSYADATVKYSWPNKNPGDAVSPHLSGAFDDFTIRLF